MAFPFITVFRAVQYQYKLLLKNFFLKELSLISYFSKSTFIMRLLECEANGSFSLINVVNNIPPYAILSHTWGAYGEEVTFNDITNRLGMAKPGYEKIRFCANQAASDGLRFFWVDSCCIDKSSSAELSEAINSMFRWYRDAARCYHYLSDVSSGGYSELHWESAFRKSRSFTRGWLLQELLAPQSVVFFSREGYRLGDKSSLEEQIHEITGLPVEALRGAPLHQFSIEERLSWAERRQTTLPEDQAYCLFGICDINLPVIYGEGQQNAFSRLIKELDSSRVSLAPSTEAKLYRPLGASEFRLFILLPGLEGNEIVGRIETFYLLAPPKYAAVSYVWGDHRAIHRIDVNHRQIFLRPNLFQALQRMRSPTNFVFLWIDSLCINQSDKTERSEQVGKMAEIYQNAENVWIWLGEEDSTSESAMNLVPHIIKPRFDWNAAWWENENFRAFDQLLGRPWFRRRWVIQEAAASTNPIFICGDSRVHMIDFAHAVSLVQARLENVPMPGHNTGTNRPHNKTLLNFRDSPATRILEIIDNVFRRSTDGAILARNLSLETLVDLAAFCETSDQRDVVFALLSMASDVQPFSSSHMTKAIVADYSKSLVEVYADFVLHCCLSSDSLDIICRPWASLPLSTVYTNNFRGLSGSEPQFPSWIARIDHLPFANTSLRANRRIHGKPLVGNSQDRVYNAHNGTKPHVCLEKGSSTHTWNGSLSVKGIILGEITHRSTRMAEAIISSDCLSILGMRPFGQQMQSIPPSDTIWRTLCANRVDGKPAPPSFCSAMTQAIQLSIETTRHEDHRDAAQYGASIDVEDLLDRELPEEVAKFLNNTRDVICNRRTFRGRRHGGMKETLVGLIPQKARLGDQVCILYGCSVPVILGKREFKDGCHWRLIGEAYVDGFMEGEGISSMSLTAPEVEEVIFCIR